MHTPKHFIPEPFEYHQEIELTIDTLTNLGVGLGRVDGWVVMVPFSLPGERVRARVYRNHKQHSEADLIKVIEPSPERVEPRCKLFGECGGCQYQHLSYQGQLDWKTQQVQELMQRLGELKLEVEPAIGSPQTFGYRSKLTPHYPRPRDKDFPIGFLRNGRRNSIIDVPQCPIATDAINEALPIERERLRDQLKGKKRGGTMLLRHVIEGVTTDHKAVVSERVGKRSFQFQAGDFFQNNPFILPKLIDYVIEQAQAEGVEYLVDAYCGAGIFGISASDHFKNFAGVEISASSIKWANANAVINGVHNGSFLIGEAESIFAGLEFPPEHTTIIIDPPRKGCDTTFLNQLMAFAPKRVVYVSCGPDTQARDLKTLCQSVFEVERIQPFDLFPQTRHIESVATLRKRV